MPSFCISTSSLLTLSNLPAAEKASASTLYCFDVRLIRMDSNRSNTCRAFSSFPARTRCSMITVVRPLFHHLPEDLHGFRVHPGSGVEAHDEVVGFGARVAPLADCDSGPDAVPGPKRGRDVSRGGVPPEAVHGGGGQQTGERAGIGGVQEGPEIPDAAGSGQGLGERVKGVVGEGEGWVVPEGAKEAKSDVRGGRGAEGVDGHEGVDRGEGGYGEGGGGVVGAEAEAEGVDETVTVEALGDLGRGVVGSSGGGRGGEEEAEGWGDGEGVPAEE
ncbi:hypothetical protein Taro_013791 [Colocasia esculenta]|uniref:Uncharacterized protein n=1 Tax=Colocasia esculenta TaxID=4460 RepID=A0A843UCV1_COLES|nr:hypothetical protein [Colocasia esculenta]